MTIDAGAGRHDMRAVARRERLGRLAVDGDHADIVIGDPQRDDGAMAAIDEAQPHRSLPRAAIGASSARPLMV